MATESLGGSLDFDVGGIPVVHVREGEVGIVPSEARPRTGGETAVPASEPQAPIDFEQFERRLRQQMKDVLSAHRTWKAASTAFEAANDEFTRFPYANGGRLPPHPVTADQDLIHECVVAMEDHFTRQYEYFVKNQRCRAAVIAARTALKAALDALVESETLIDQYNKEGWKSFETLVRAAHHLRFSLNKLRDFEAPEIELPQPRLQLSQQEQADLAASRMVLRESLLVANRAVQFAQDLETAVAEFKKYKDAPGHLVPPARESSEEIQRYVRQIEDWMTKRQRASRQVANLCEEYDAWSKRLSQQSKLLGQVDDVEGETSCVHKYALAECARAIRGRFTDARSHMRDAAQVSDKIREQLEPRESITVTSDREQQQIVKLREQMSALATMLARVNEASGALRLEQNVELPPIPSMKGFIDCRSFAECRKLLAEKRAEQKRYRLVLNRRTLKSTLINEGSMAYRDAALAAAKELRRLTVMSLPLRDRLPCDKLRVVINAAAWMHKRHSDRHDAKHRTGDFPVY